MIKFVFGQENKTTLTFDDVENDQLFVDSDGKLCAKIDVCSYVTVAEEDGTPYFEYFDNVNHFMRIQRILPKLDKIEF